MNKQKTFSIVALIGYALFFIAGFLIIFGLVNKVETDGTLGSGILAVFVAIFSVILGFIYVGISIVPIVLKAVSLFKDKKALTVICIPFDIILLVISFIYCSSVLKDFSSNVLAAVVSIVLTLTAVVTLVSNVMNIVYFNKQSKEISNE